MNLEGLIMALVLFAMAAYCWSDGHRAISLVAAAVGCSTLMEAFGTTPGDDS